MIINLINCLVLFNLILSQPLPRDVISEVLAKARLERQKMSTNEKIVTKNNKIETKIIVVDDEKATTMHCIANDNKPSRIEAVSPRKGTTYRTTTLSENIVANP